MGRRKPYTTIGIRRLKCIRCGGKAVHQWQVCADDRQYRPICLDCDVAVNELVLTFMNIPNAEEKMVKYRTKAGVF